MTENQKKIKQIIDSFSGKKGVLIPLLQEIQKVEKLFTQRNIAFCIRENGNSFGGNLRSSHILHHVPPKTARKKCNTSLQGNGVSCV